MRIVIELKRDAIPKVVLNKLYKHTPMQTTFGVNTVALVDNVPRTLPLRGVIHFYVQHQREVIVRRAKHELRTLEAQVHRLEGLLIALENLDAVIELIRGSRDRDAAREGLIERFGAHPHPGPGDPRAAPAAADRARGRLDQARARRQGRAHPRAARAARRRGQGLRPDQGGAARDLRALRRRAPHRDHPRRGRRRHRGPDRRPADGHRDHALGLHQVPAARHLPHAAPRRGRRHRHGHEGRRLHRAPLRVLDARLPAVLHQPRQGLPLEGLRAARGRPHVQGPLPRQRAAAARGRARAVRAGHARLLGVRLPRVRDPSRHGQEDRVPGLQHADQGRRHHRHQHPRRGRARRRPARRRGRRGADGLERRPGRALLRGATPARWAATPAASAAWTCRTTSR